MNFTLRQLRYVVKTARFGSLSDAATELHVSQPSLTAAIDALEAQFGHKLFVRRRGSGATITPFGQTVIDQARRVLEETRRLESLAFAAGEVAGELHLGCFDELAPYCAAALMREVEREHPRLRVLVREEDFVTVRRRLADGSVDLALTYDLDLDGSVTTTVLREVRPHALLAFDHPLAEQSAVSLAALAAYPLVLSDQPASWRHMLELFQMHDLHPAVQSRTRSFEMQRSLVANGYGVALVYAEPFSLASYDGKRLCRRPVIEPLPSQRVVLARDLRQPTTAAIDALTAVALRWFDVMGPPSTEIG